MRAFNSAGNSAFSNTASAKTSAPAAPSSLTAQASASDRINLNWKDNSSNESGFKIERCKGSGCTGFTEIAQVAAGATSYSSRNLSSDTTYIYRVRAYNGAGNSAYSNTASAKTLP
jgi:hypothetical protein